MINYKTINKAIILYDGKCALCNKYIRFVIRFDKNDKLRFATIQSNIAKVIIKDYCIKDTGQDSIILHNRNKVLLKSDAVIAILHQLSFPINMSYILYILPSFIRDYIYDIISKNRYKMFKKSKECIIPETRYLHKFLT